MGYNFFFLSLFLLSIQRSHRANQCVGFQSYVFDRQISFFQSSFVYRLMTPYYFWKLFTEWITEPENEGMGRSRDHYLPKLHGFLVAHFNSIPASILYFERACRYCQKHQTKQKKSLLTFTYLQFDTLVNTQKKKGAGRSDHVCCSLAWPCRRIPVRYRPSQKFINEKKKEKINRKNFLLVISFQALRVPETWNKSIPIIETPKLDNEKAIEWRKPP
mgnify:CR=1 FL=1